MSAPSNSPDMGALASQNLFEHMASTSGTTLQAVTPAELGANIMNKLEGSIERVQNFSSRISENTDAPQVASSTESMGGEEAGGLGDAQFERMIESFGALFDHAVEARLISTCASQVSGSCTTLLRGQ